MKIRKLLALGALLLISVVTLNVQMVPPTPKQTPKNQVSASYMRKF